MAVQLELTSTNIWRRFNLRYRPNLRQGFSWLTTFLMVAAAAAAQVGVLSHVTPIYVIAFPGLWSSVIGGVQRRRRRGLTGARELPSSNLDSWSKLSNNYRSDVMCLKTTYESSTRSYICCCCGSLEDDDDDYDDAKFCREFEMVQRGTKQNQLLRRSDGVRWLWVPGAFTDVSRGWLSW